MNEQKRSELYSTGKSLNGKSGKQAFGKKEKKKKTRKQMLPDKNLLILTGRHPPVYILCTFTVFQKSSDFLSYALQPSCTRMGHIQL